MNENNILDDKLSCLFTEIGKEVGTIVRCLIQTEIQSKLQSIELWQSLPIEGNSCKTE